MRAAKVQASLCIRAVSPEPLLLAHTSSESRGTFRQKARSLAPLNGWACAVEICHDGMLEDTNSLDGAHLISTYLTYLEVVTKIKINEIAAFDYLITGWTSSLLDLTETSMVMHVVMVLSFRTDRSGQKMQTQSDCS